MLREITIVVLMGLCLFSCTNNPPQEVSADNKTETTIEAPTVEPRQTLERLSNTCAGLEYRECSCEYRLKGENVKEAAFFVSDMGATACVQINGQVVQLKSREAVYRQELQPLVAYTKNNKDWIVLPKDGPIQYFGQPLPEGREATQYVSDVLLLLADIPAELPIRNDAEGMGIREVRDIAADAIASAKKRQADADFLYFKDDVYYNDAYELIVDTKQITQYEGEANTYEGELILKDKEGTMLHTQPVSGTCGC